MSMVSSAGDLDEILAKSASQSSSVGGGGCGSWGAHLNSTNLTQLMLFRIPVKPNCIAVAAIVLPRACTEQVDHHPLLKTRDIPQQCR